MLPSLRGICMTPCNSFCLRKGGLACFDLPVCWVHWWRRAEGWRGGWRWRAKRMNGGLSSLAQLHVRKKNLGLWTTKIDVQLPGSHAKGKPYKKKVRVHNLHIHSCLPFTWILRAYHKCPYAPCLRNTSLTNPLRHLAPANIFLAPNVLMKCSTAHEKKGVA